MTTHICKRCGKQHDLFYRLQANGQEVLLYVCDRTRESFLIKYVSGLEIPHTKSQKLRNQEKRKSGPTLL